MKNIFLKFTYQNEEHEMQLVPYFNKNGAKVTVII